MKPLPLLVIALLLALALGACSAPQPDPTVTPTLPAATATPSPTAEPSPTATELPRRVLLINPAQADPGLSSQVQTALAELASSSGLVLETLSDLPAGALDAGVQLVVVLDPAPALADWLAASPAAHFVGVGLTAPPAAANLSTINLNRAADQQGFLAGSLAATITTDWRVAVLAVEGDPTSQAAAQGFLAGVRYTCGLCRPAYPPYPGYPLAASLPTGSADSTWLAALQTLLANETDVQTVYLAPGVPAAVLQAELANLGGWAVTSTPLGDEISPSLAGAVYFDAAETLRQNWSALLESPGGLAFDALLAFQPGAAELFSPARQRLVEQTRQDLLGGFIDTGVTP